jgi:hypothetical protein
MDVRGRGKKQVTERCAGTGADGARCDANAMRISNIASRREVQERKKRRIRHLPAVGEGRLEAGSFEAAPFPCSLYADLYIRRKDSMRAVVQARLAADRHRHNSFAQSRV